MVEYFWQQHFMGWVLASQHNVTSAGNLHCTSLPLVLVAAYLPYPVQTHKILKLSPPSPPSGSRYVRPPIIMGDVEFKGPMTVREFKVAQGLTNRPVKGMLTGPVTILNWSFPRKDLSRSGQAFQLALALRQEVDALQEAGCKIVQVGFGG